MHLGEFCYPDNNWDEMIFDDMAKIPMNCKVSYKIESKSLCV